MKNKFYDLRREIIIVIITFLVTNFFIILPFYISGINNNKFILGNAISNFMGQLVNPFSTFEKFFKLEDKSQFFSISGYTFLVIFGIYVYYKIKNGSTHEYDGEENGSSDWAKNGEEFRKLSDGSECLNRHDGFILSRHHYLGTDQKKVKINKNILVIGGSGAGKSACYVKPNIMQKLGSYVLTDPKGELYRETSKYLKANGYEIKVLNLIETEYSNRYNPLAHIKDHNDVNIIAETIIRGGSDTGKSSDPFWDNTAVMLLKACIYYVISVLPKEEQNLSSCLNIIRAGGSDETILDKLFVRELKPEHPGRKEYESIRLAADKTKQSIAISVAAKLKDFDSPSIQKVTANNEFDFSEIGKKKMAIYVITPPDHSTYDYIMTVFFSQMFQVMFADAYKRGGALENPVYMLLDEFANIGQIPDFPKKLSTTRSYGISVSIIIQALDQLESLYKDDYETIIGNCDTQVFLGSQSIKTCEYINKSLGQKTIKFQSKSINKDKTETEKQGVSFSEQRQGRDLMTIDEIKRLNPNKEILLIRGLRPILADKAWYFKYHKERKVINDYKIHDLSETPLPPKMNINTFDVNRHLDEVDNKIKESLYKKKEEIKAPLSNIDIEFDDQDNSIKDNNNSLSNNKVEFDNSDNDKNSVDDEFDLQKELEKKFDELFGSNESN